MAHKTQDPGTTTNRLFAAADVLLRALNSPRGKNTRVRMYVVSARNGGALPKNRFTPEEFVEAMAMLSRMGFVPEGVSPSGDSRRAGRDGRGQRIRIARRSGNVPGGESRRDAAP